MKANNIIISILVFVCFALYVKIELTPDCKDCEKEWGAYTKRLEAQNDSLKQCNSVLDGNYDRLQEKASQLQEKLSVINQTIVQLKKQQHEKVNAIDTLTNDELYGFFSNFNAQSSTGE